jgi:CubicO group peptidase (beta-lactamase class C family)
MRRAHAGATVRLEGGLGALCDIVETHVGSGAVPGAVALVGHRERVELAAVGSVDLDGVEPITRSSIVRIASVTKLLTAAAAMLLVDDGTLALDDPVREWLPELGSPVVVRTPASDVDDLVPLERPITVADLLTSRAGYGMPADPSLPAYEALYAELQEHNVVRDLTRSPDEWMAALARIPLLHQPGEAWLYNTCPDILGVLIARAAGCPLTELMDERLFAPLGMSDTAFEVPAGKRDRFAGWCRTAPDGALELVEDSEAPTTTLPAFPSGAFGLFSTADDLHAFARMLLGRGTTDGRRILSSASVAQMTTNHLTRRQRAQARWLLDGQGWGFGGSVDVEGRESWNASGRYGWIGVTGAALHVVPATGSTTIVLAPVGLPGIAPSPLMRDVWRYAAAAA